MNGNYETETLESLLGELDNFESDGYESDIESDFSERSGGHNRRYGQPRQPRTAPGRGLFQPRPSTNYVTQVQLQTALARVGEQIKTNSEAIKAVSHRVTTIGAEQSRQTAVIKKEVAERKKETDQLKKELRQTREMNMLLPLLSRPKNIQLAKQTDTLPAGTKVLVDSDDTLSFLLPFMLMGGMGGSESGGGGMFGGGGDNSMMMIVLAMTLAKR